MLWSGAAEPEHRAWTMTRGRVRQIASGVPPSASPSPSARAPTRSRSPTDVAAASGDGQGPHRSCGLAITVTRNYGADRDEKANELLFHLALATVSIVVLITVAIGWREGVVVLDRHPDHDPADALRVMDDGLHDQPRQPVRAHFLDRHSGRRRDRRRREHRPPLVGARRHAGSSTPRSRRSPKSAIRPSSPPSTIIAALLPMMFVSGLMGPYMSPIPANASMAMLFSFFVAVTVDAVAAAAHRGPAFPATGAGGARAHAATSARWAASISASRGRCSRAGRSARRSFSGGRRGDARRLRALRHQGRDGQAPAVRQQVGNPGRRRSAAGRDARGHRARADGGRRPAEGPARTDLDPGLCGNGGAIQLQRPGAPLLSARAMPSRAICRSIC